MKIESIYLTVRVDIECPDHTTTEECEAATSELDYNFDFYPDSYPGFKVINTEICGVNE